MCRLVPFKTNIGTEVLVADIKLDFIRGLVESAKNVSSIEKVVLFGSSLRTDCREDSDVDFAVYVNEDENSWLLGKDSELFVNGLSNSVDYFQDYDMVYRDTSKNYNSLLNDEIVRGDVIYVGT